VWLPGQDEWGMALARRRRGYLPNPLVSRDDGPTNSGISPARSPGSRPMSDEETSADRTADEAIPPESLPPDPGRDPEGTTSADGESGTATTGRTANTEEESSPRQGINKLGNLELNSLSLDTSLFFCDEHGESYAHVPCDDPKPHHRVMQVRSSEMDQYISMRCLEKTGTFPDRGTRNDYRDVMLALAWYGGTRTLGNRFVRTTDDGQDVIWIDMADETSRAIRVTGRGWRIIDNPPPLFRRHKHQLSLVEPAGGSDPRELFSFLPPMEKSEELLCMTWLATVPVSNIARPILLPVGPQGSAKTSLCRRFRTILDPSRVPLLGEDGRRDLLLTVYTHALPAFDNLGRISGPESDLLCRVVTGGGTERRKLFTDLGEVILSFRRPILMNGINLPSDRPDLLDRSIVIRVSRIEKPRSEEILDAEFAEALPRLLGSVLDLLVGAMGCVQQVEPAPGFRMADFSRWGRAVALSLGHSLGDFDAAYRQAVERQSGEIIDKSPLAQAMIRFAEEKQSWSGSAAALLDQLTQLARQFKILGSGSNWPGAANVLSEQLVTLAPVLKQAGVEVVKLPRKKNVRSQWTVRLVTQSPGGDATHPEDGNRSSPVKSFQGNDLRQDDAGDGRNPSSLSRDDLIRLSQDYLTQEARS